MLRQRVVKHALIVYNCLRGQPISPAFESSRGNPAMLSPETLDQYRRMTTSQRLRLTLDLIREATPSLLQGTPEQVERRFELLRRQNDERNLRMLTGIARTGESK
jgi:hypothetical protein